MDVVYNLNIAIAPTNWVCTCRRNFMLLFMAHLHGWKTWSYIWALPKPEDEGGVFLSTSSWFLICHMKVNSLKQIYFVEKLKKPEAINCQNDQRFMWWTPWSWVLDFVSGSGRINNKFMNHGLIMCVWWVFMVRSQDIDCIIKLSNLRNDGSTRI